MRNTAYKSEADLLRQKAVAFLHNKPLGSGSQLSESELLKLIHELEVHQIELELQNEELVLARAFAQDATKKYAELYDFAPSGYFSLSKEGEIIEVNTYGANMLGKECKGLKKGMFGFFISDDTKPIFNNFLTKVFISTVKETCEVALSINANTPTFVYISGITIENSEQCLLTVIDITDRKLVVALKKKSDELVHFNNLMLGREVKMIELKREVNDLLIGSGKEEKYIIHE